jgi:hypothetical protein
LVAISVLAHQAVRWIETGVQPVDWDGQNGLTMVIFQPEKQPEATKLTAQDITNFLGLRRYQTSSRPAWGAGFSIFTVIFTKVW